MLYPDVKHSWLCDGKLLRLLDPQQPSNFKLFNQRWTLGMPRAHKHNNLSLTSALPVLLLKIVQYP